LGRRSCLATLPRSAQDRAAAGSAGQCPHRHAAVRAHALYKALFGQVEDLIRDKHLLIVPSGPLTQLPFQVLVTAAPAVSNHRSTQWLARKHALTVLPSVSSLKALRRVAKPSVATKPMIGFGNPLLTGPDARYAALAQAALEKQQCPKAIVAGLSGARGGATVVTQQGGLVDVADIRVQSPLPETADESGDDLLLCHG
jgi:CHAT domain-containing protein